MASWTYDSTNEANLMKINYDKLQKEQFNQENIVFGRMKVMEDFEGSQIQRDIKQSIGGGVGAGSLPTSNINKIGKALLSSKKLYGVVSIDRETMKAAKSDKGSFVRMTVFPVQVATDSFNRNLERMITVGDASGSGALATGNASNSNCSGIGSAGDPYVIVLDAASTYYDTDAAPFEEGDLVNINTETTPLEIVTIATTATSVTLSLTGSSARMDVIGDTGTPAAFGASDKIYMQNSKDNEMIGIRGVISATSGSLYGITVGRRWQAYQKSAASAAISTDLLNDVIINVKKKSGKAPKFVLTSYTQYIKLLNLLDDQKRYNVPARRGEFSFEGIEYLGPDGTIPIFASRFVPADEVFFLNDDQIELHLRPGGLEWFDEDGTVFLREATDSYEARYGGYGQLFVNPHFQGYLHTLAV